jgi:hypothetical protein
MSIDTPEYTKKLEAAGVDRKVAEAHAEALREGVADEVATKRDLDAATSRLSDEIQKLRARVDVHNWMLGFNLAATMAVLWKLLVVR